MFPNNINIDLKKRLERGVGCGVGGVGEGVVVDKLWLVTEAAALRVEELPHLGQSMAIAKCESDFCDKFCLKFLGMCIYLLQTIRNRLKFMINFLHCEVNVKFEVELQVHFVTFFVGNKLCVIPNLQ